MDPPPARRLSGAWADGGDLLVQETGGGRLLRYSLDGGLLTVVEDEALSGVVALSPAPDGSLAVSQFSRLTARDASGRIFATYELAAQRGGGLRVLNASDLVAVGEEVVTLSFVELASGERTEALVRARAVPYRPQRVHWTFDGDWRGEIFYRLAKQSLATAGGEVYFLCQSEPPAIVHLGEGEPRPLAAFPAGFERLPKLPAIRGRESTVPLYRALAASPGAAALAGGGDHLFLLTRRPGEGGTRWTVHRIDPRADRVTTSWDLPLRSPHLTMVPGPTWWAFLARGPIEQPADQVIESVLLVPAQRLRGGAAGSLCD